MLCRPSHCVPLMNCWSLSLYHHLSPTLVLSSALAGCCVALLQLKVAADVSGRWWRMVASYNSNLQHLTVFVGTLQHFTAFTAFYSILQHFTVFVRCYSILQHFTATYSICTSWQHFTAFYNICTYFTAFYSILQHLYVHTCSCRREARRWDMR